MLKIFPEIINITATIVYLNDNYYVVKHHNYETLLKSLKGAEAEKTEVKLMTEKEPIRKYRTVENKVQIMCYQTDEKCGKNCPQMKLWQQVAAYQKLGFECLIKNGGDVWETKFSYDPLEMLYS